MKKMFALSFDDGTISDQRLVELLNAYHIKATFHLNGALFPSHAQPNEGNRLPLKQLKTLLVGHEVAAHGFTHPDLTRLSVDQIQEEILSDIQALDQGFDQSTLGFAYPFGLVNDKVIACLKQTKLIYARTIENTYTFDVPHDPYRLNPTCHCKEERLMELAEKFVNSASDEPQFFLVWGHSVEFEHEEDWARFEDFLKTIAHKSDVFYGSILSCYTHLNQQAI
jgi:peptidoglycan/xylan/chitin deacetylase (PgdA/CDA1 family)